MKKTMITSYQNVEKIKIPSVYLQNNFYYFKIFEDGKRKTKATGCSDIAKAQNFVKDYLEKKAKEPIILVSKTSLADLLRPFADIETNPKRAMAIASGSCYGVPHAKTVARTINYFAEFLTKYFKLLFYRNIKDVTRKDIFNIIQKLIEIEGRNCKTREMVKSFKSALSWAFSIGDIDVDLSSKIPNIKVEKVTNKVQIICTEDIKYIINHPEFQYCEMAYDYVCIAIATGMRRAEIAALTKAQISYDVNNNMIININRAYKESWNEAGLPKWNLSRVIPASLIARKAIENRIDKSSNNLLFPFINSRKITIWFKYFRAQLGLNSTLLVDTSFIKDVSSHAFRHSLNTNLRVTGLADILIAEYLSWEHQSDIEVQQIYTHIMPIHLIKIAKKIDEIYLDSTDSKIKKFS